MRRWLPGVMLGLGIAGAGLIAREAFGQEKVPHPASRAEAKDFKNPILHTRASVAQGKLYFFSVKKVCGFPFAGIRECCKPGCWVLQGHVPTRDH